MAYILVIDDDDVMRSAICQILRIEGYTPIEASNGEIGMELFKKNEFKLVITDIVMPEKEGLETIQNLKRISGSIPIIAVSGGGKFNSDIYLDLARSFGAKFTFSKPFDRETFIIAVKNCLGE